MDQMIPRPDWNENSSFFGDSPEPAPTPEPTPIKFTTGDVCYALFRHKWLILVSLCLGLIAAGLIYVLSPRLYVSEAQLLVKYVPELEPVRDDTTGEVRSPVLRGDVAAGTEVAILQSMDLAKKVATNIGPERILAKQGGGSDPDVAAMVIKKGIMPEVPPGGSVVTVLCSYPDPALTQEILTELLNVYFPEHDRIHRALANVQDFERRKKEIYDESKAVEAQLWQLRSSNDVLSIDDAKKTAEDDIQKIKSQLTDAQSELELRQAGLQMLEGRTVSPTTVKPDPATLEEDAKQYSQILLDLQRLRKTESEYAGQYLSGSKMLTSIENDIAKKELEKTKLEKKNPALIAIGPANGNQERFDPVSEKQKIDLLGVKIASLTASLEKARKEQTRIYDIERPIKELELKKQALDKNYMFFLTALEKAQFDAALGSSRNSSISILENPTVPAIKMKSLVKRMAMAVGGGLFIGVGLALLLELFVNQGVKRPIELQRLLPVPLFISIPKVAHRLGAKQLTNGSAHGELDQSNGKTKLISRGTESEDEELQPYFEALRDRVLNRFENLARKPKLVGVCGCAEGRGSSTTAAGLAAALSEAGDLKVLLVDMKPGLPGAVRSARRSCTLLEALGEKKREEALIAPNLYVASAEDGESAKAVTSPRRFTTVVPQLNASDYDYVVFDMPVVDQISVTPRLAKYMDLTLLVVEADKAHRNAVKQAGALLLEFTPKMATVMHNAEANLPKWLQDAL